MRYLVAQAIALSTLIACSQALAKQESEANTPVSQQPSISQATSDNFLGLPPVPIPADNPQSPAKIALGDKLFHDKRFSIDGTVSCANCHDDNKAFTDNLPVSVGHHGLTGTRNAPTVLNAAFNRFQFWDGREPDLEGQPLAADDPKMIALQAYVTYERRGVKLEPGKH